MNRFFYKYTANCDHLESFLQQKVWLNPLNKLNDPFEATFNIISLSFSIFETDPGLFQLFFKKFKEDDPSITENNFKQMLRDPSFIERLEKRNKNRIKDFFKQGILCLTQSGSNIPMWAYYANNHEGYCVEFELDFSGLCQSIEKNTPGYLAEKHVNNMFKGKEILSWHPHTKDLEYNKVSFYFTKINYGDTIPTIDLNKMYLLEDGYEKNKYIIENSAGFKFNQWTHEEEFRLISDLNSVSQDCCLMDLKNVPFLKVVGIILGEKMPEDEKKKAKRLCNEYQIKIYQADCSESEYLIERKEIVSISESEKTERLIA